MFRDDDFVASIVMGLVVYGGGCFLCGYWFRVQVNRFLGRVLDGHVGSRRDAETQR